MWNLVEYAELRAFFVEFHVEFLTHFRNPRRPVTNSLQSLETTKPPAVANYARLAIKEQSNVTVTLVTFPTPSTAFFTFFFRLFSADSPCC